MGKKLRQDSLIDGDETDGFEEQEDWSRDGEIDIRNVMPRHARPERKASALRAIEERRERLRLRNELYDLHFGDDGAIELD